jgi:hypothetical protein
VRTFDEHVYDSFESTARAMHLLADNQESRRCMLEACAEIRPAAIRDLFATLLQFGPPRNPEQLFDEFVAVRSRPFH